MNLIQITDDNEINRAIYLWKRVKEDHKNLTEVDATILNDAEKDKYIGEFIGVQAISEEFRRLQIGLRLYQKLQEPFAYFIAKKIATRLNIGKLERETYIAIGKSLLDS